MDEQDILWDLFSRNKIESVSAEIRCDGHDYAEADFEDIKILPKSKFPLVFEPVLPPKADVREIILSVAIDSVMAEYSVDLSLDLRQIFIVTFFVKDKRISVDVLGL